MVSDKILDKKKTTLLNSGGWEEAVGAIALPLAK